MYCVPVKGSNLELDYKFQNRYSVKVDRTKSQWIDLGIQTKACMTRPETCGAAGGAVSVWVNIIDCPGYRKGVLSSALQLKTHSKIDCDSTHL